MITLCILAKNEASILPKLIASTQDYVEQIILVDDYSTDDTEEAVQSFSKVKYLQPPESVSTVGFGKVSTWMINQVNTEWTLILDADELMPEIMYLPQLTRTSEKTIWALPRRKWLSYDKQQRDEYEAYPDWQIRFWKTSKDYSFEGEMHVRFSGKKVSYAYRGPHIEHLQLENRTVEKIEQRKVLYTNLADKQGVYIIGGLTKPKGSNDKL